MIRILTFSALSIILVSSCSDKTVELDGFDKQKWSNDKYGCNEVRLTFITAVSSQKEKILTLNQNQVKKVLGNPDEHELYERTRKFFHYYLEPTQACDSTITKEPKILQIRFNALGLCNEVFIKNE